MAFIPSSSSQSSATKWADYCISAVSFNAAHTHIDRVRLHVDNGATLGPVAEHARAAIVAAIKQGTTFMTVFRGADGNWRAGQHVYIITIHGIEFIKTVNNGKAADNLDNLPEF